MSCEEIAPKILDYQEGQLSPAQRAEVAGHLAGCAGCRRLAWQLQQLDVAFATGIKAPKLSADFDRRLWAEIQMGPAALTAAQRAERKRQLQAEFEGGLTRLHRGTFALRNLLSQMIWPVLAITAGGVAWFFTAELTARFNGHGLDGLTPTQLAWLVASGVLFTVGLPGLFPGRWQDGREGAGDEAQKYGRGGRVPQ